MMLKQLEEFKDIIKKSIIKKYEVSGNSIKLRMELLRVDDSKLYVRETIISGEKRKYSYHWQDQNQKLIKRWDNAPDGEVETFLHHLHIGDDTVTASYERSLEQVLRVIMIEIG